MLSRYPFFDAFRRFLMSLYRLTVSGKQSIPIERYFPIYLLKSGMSNAKERFSGSYVKRINKNKCNSNYIFIFNTASIFKKTLPKMKNQFVHITVTKFIFFCIEIIYLFNFVFLDISPTLCVMFPSQHLRNQSFMYR